MAVTQSGDTFTSDGAGDTFGATDPYDPDGNGPIEPSGYFFFGNGGDDSIFTWAYSNADALFGGSGNDTLAGLNGNDTLDGGADNDDVRTYGGSGVVIYHQRAGSMSITGGSGTDIARSAFDFATNNLNLDFSGNSTGSLSVSITGASALAEYAANFQAFTNTYSSFERVDISGGLGQDTLIGGDLNDTLYGGRDLFSITGAGPNDYIYQLDQNNTIRGGLGHDSLVGAGGEDLIYGGDFGDTGNATNDNDTINGGAGNDIIYGGGGDDSILGASGGDILIGGDGNDSIDDTDAVYTYATTNDSFGFDRLEGGNGNDTLSAAGQDTYYGGQGDDQIIIADNVASPGRNGLGIVHGGGGNDLIDIGPLGEYFTGTLNVFGDGVDNPSGGTSLAGNDTINGSFFPNATLTLTVDAGAGDDTVSLNFLGNNAPATVQAGSGNDAVDLTGRGTVYGGSGNDTIGGSNVAGHFNSFYGEDGNDFLSATNWRPNLANYTADTADNGADSLYGGAGNDTLDGGFGADRLEGGTGDDVYVVTDGLDTIIEAAGGGYDTVRLPVNYLIPSGGFNYTAFTMADHIERAILQGGALTLTGNGLDNLIELVDNGATPTVVGGAGRDTLVGSSGYEVLTGGAGADVFSFGNGGIDVLTDLEVGPNPDRIDVTERDLISFSDILSIATQDGADVVLTFAFSGSLRLLNVQLGDLTGSNFIFDPNPYTNDGTPDPDNLQSFGGLDHLRGFGSNDTLTGGLGNDTLDGGTGDDSMTGGKGDDVYIVDSLGDRTIENAGEGTDRIETDLANFTLTDLAQIEDLTLTGGAVGIAEGNVSANRITRQGSADSILYGSAGDDTLTGGTGNDTLYGGSDRDSMIGGAGNDVYSVLDVGDTVVELVGGGNDIAYVSAYQGSLSHVETVIAQGSGLVEAAGDDGVNQFNAATGQRFAGVSYSALGGADVLYGSNYADSLDGGADGDILIGYSSVGGADSLTGGSGDDVYYVFEADDVLTELAGGGFDTVYAYANITLAAEVEQAVLVGAGTLATGNAVANNIFGNNLSAALTIDGLGGNDWLVGGAGDDTLRGGGDNDILIGLGGANRLEGGAGDDQIFSFAAGDTIIENAAEGFDTLYATVNIAALADHVEQLVIYGGATIGNGNALANALYLNNSGVAVSADAGAGQDVIYGSNFGDTITGGLGNDTMAGGAGADRYAYAAGAMGADTITDFADGTDLMVLTGLGYTAGSLGGAITIGGGANALVTFASGSLTGTTITLLGVNQASLSAADFVF